MSSAVRSAGARRPGNFPAVRRGPTRRRRAMAVRRQKHLWVRKVQQTSDAMDLPVGIFKRSPAGIARGLKRAVLQSRRTKGSKFQSAMSMLNLYANRAGRALSGRERARLETAKIELRKVFGRPSARRSRPRPAGPRAPRRAARRRRRRGP